MYTRSAQKGRNHGIQFLTLLIEVVECVENTFVVDQVDSNQLVDVRRVTHLHYGSVDEHLRAEERTEGLLRGIFFNRNDVLVFKGCVSD